MYSLNTSQADRKSKNLKPEAETGSDFAKEESFSFEIEAEREYVHRLKMQRQKIEALYNKYDTLLEQMRRKDEKIREQKNLITDLNNKYKDLSLMLPQMEMLRREHSDLIIENDQTRISLAQIEEAYHHLLSEQKNRKHTNSQEKQKIEELNEQLSSKLRIIQQKFQDKQQVQEKQKKTLSEKNLELQKELQLQESRHISEISFMNEELLRRDEDIDVLSKENQKLRELLGAWEQSNIDLKNQNDQKTQKIHNEYKAKVKSIKQQIQELSYSNEILSSKISSLNAEVEKITSENTTLRGVLNEEKKMNEDNIFQLKLQGNQERSIMREKCIQLEGKLAKTEKLLGDSLRRQRQLSEHIQKIEETDKMKKNLRSMEKRELQKINRLLLLEK